MGTYITCVKKLGRLFVDFPPKKLQFDNFPIPKIWLQITFHSPLINFPCKKNWQWRIGRDESFSGRSGRNSCPTAPKYLREDPRFGGALWQLVAYHRNVLGGGKIPISPPPCDHRHRNRDRTCGMRGCRGTCFASGSALAPGPLKWEGFDLSRRRALCTCVCCAVFRGGAILSTTTLKKRQKTS